MKSLRAGEILFDKEENIILAHTVGMESGSTGFQAPPVISLVNEATRLGVTLSVQGSFIDWSSAQAPPAAFLDCLRIHKPELVELLRGDLCRHCGKRLVWSHPGAIAFGDSTASHLVCFEEAEVERLLASARPVVENPLAWADEAEIMLHGGPLP